VRENTRALEKRNKAAKKQRGRLVRAGANPKPYTLRNTRP